MNKILFVIGVTIFILLSFLFPTTVLQGATNGLTLWFQQLLPTLLPYIILSNIVIQSGLLDLSQHNKKKQVPLKPILITYLFGLILGLPIAAILVTNFYKRHLLTRTQASILICCCNQLSPFFFINYIFHNNTLHKTISISNCLLPMYLLFIVVGSFFLALDFKRNNHSYFRATCEKKTTSRFHLSFQIIDAGIMNGFEVITKLGGYIILFGIITSLCLHIIPITSNLRAIAIASMEITNGISILSTTLPHNLQQINIMMALAVFGGLCTHAQTYSILSGTDIPKIIYTFSKIALALLTYGLLYMLSVILY